MKIVWLSANRLGYELLKEALRLPGVSISAVVTLSDAAKTVMYDSVPARKWGRLGVSVFPVEEINQERALFKRLAPDLVVMCGWRQIVDRDILRMPRKGVIGFHPTLLPQGRGPAPLINTLLAGSERSGLSMFHVSEGLDDGDIIAQKEFKIGPADHADDVYRKMIAAGKKLIREFLPEAARGAAPRAAQDHSRAFLFPKPSLKNNRIDLDHETLEQAYRKIKALSKPYRGAYIEKGAQRLIIWRAELKDAA